MSNLIEVQPEYVYTTIPREYVDVYHRILAMMADYGEDMLKDCKASCTERNSGVIECFNMFNSAVAARKLGNTKLAETLIKYVRAKIEMIYKGKDNATGFIYPLDEYGEIKAIVSSGDPIRFEIDADKGELYKLKFNDGFKSWYDLSKIQYEDNILNHIPLEDIIYNFQLFNIDANDEYITIVGNSLPSVKTYNVRDYDVNAKDMYELSKNIFPFYIYVPNIKIDNKICKWEFRTNKYNMLVAEYYIYSEDLNGIDIYDYANELCHKIEIEVTCYKIDKNIFNQYLSTYEYINTTEFSSVLDSMLEVYFIEYSEELENIKNRFEIKNNTEVYKFTIPPITDAYDGVPQAPPE